MAIRPLAALFALALATPAAYASSLGELGAAQGIHGTLSRQGTGSGRATRDIVKGSLSKSTKPRKESGVSAKRSSGKHGSSARARSGGGSKSGGRGSWVTAGGGGRSTASGWLQGGTGWSTSSTGRRSRRPRS